MQLCFATNNAHKIKEVQELLGGAIRLTSLQEIGCFEELPEERDTIEGNSLQKAQYVFSHYKVPCFADDSGLVVAALNGAPGVDSAHYAGPQRNHDENIELLLKNLKGSPDRSAYFKTVISLVGIDRPVQFTGLAPGLILHSRQGVGGFGYDPVFQPQGYSITFAEMDAHQKNSISHRGKAVNQLVDYLKSKPL